MKKFIKNTLLGIGLAVALIASDAQATLGSSTTVITAGGYSNLLATLPNVNGSVTITSVLLTTPAATASTITMTDGTTNRLTYTLPAYSNLTSYATNYITSYTNFFGVVNSFTNVALIDITNSVAASTNNYRIPFQASVATNSTVQFNGQYFFLNGVWATNAASGAGSTTVTITYER